MPYTIGQQILFSVPCSEKFRTVYHSRVRDPRKVIFGEKLDPACKLELEVGSMRTTGTIVPTKIPVYGRGQIDSKITWVSTRL